MLHHEKLQILNAIKSEDELRIELVIPLLKKMSMFQDVLDNQGPDEAGVDVIGVSTSPFKKPEYTAFILKHGDITQKAADKKNNLINIVETQIRTAIRHPLTHPRLPSDRLQAHRVIVVTNGNISRSAENALKKAFQQQADLNLDFVGQDRLIDQIDQFWPRFYEDRRPFLSSYAQKLFSSLNVVTFDQLGYAQRQRSLSDIYIDALLYEEESIAAQDLHFDKTPIPGEQLCGHSNHQLMVVTSGPGGGKSTLLKEIAISQSKNDKNGAAVYLQARDILDSKDVLRVAAQALVSVAQESVEEIYDELRKTKLLFLVDGLDELASVEDREAVIDRLVEAKSTIGARVILGTRPETNPRILAALTTFKAYSISFLRKSQIRSFFGKWFKGNLDKAAKLLSALEDKGVIDKLPRTPMTMTLVAIVYESKEDIPSSLTELYEMFVDLLIGKWDSNRKIASTFDARMKLSFLTRLAWTMHVERLDTISQDRCMDLAQDFFKTYATVKDVDVKEFIQSIIDRSHILVPTGHDQLRFSHKTFQEYFCSEQLVRNSVGVDVITDWFGEDWWKEVLFFYSGKLQDISKLIDALLASDFDNSNTRLTKLMTLGSMLQAGFLTQGKYKNAAVRFAAERFFSCYDDVFGVIDELGSQKLKRKFSRVMLLDFVQELFVSNYSSVYLVQALEDAFTSLPPEKEYESARFFVACALARLKRNMPLLDFATSPRMIDTSMYLIASSGLENQEMSSEEKDKYRRLKKRMKDFQKSIKQEIGTSIFSKRRPLVS